MKKAILPALILCFICIQSCSSTSNVQSINYLLTNTPKEANHTFLQITGDQIFINKSRLGMPATWEDVKDKIFAIDSKGERLIIKSEFKKFGSWKNDAFLMDLGNKNSIPQHLIKDVVSGPAINPTSGSICFSQKHSRELNLFILNTTKDSEAKQLTSTSVDSKHPEFSPDGSKVYFTEDEVTGTKYYPEVQRREKIYEPFIWSKDLNSGKFFKLGKGCQPSCFPNGKKVAYVRKGEYKNTELWLYDLETGNHTNLQVYKDYDVWQPAVSPDGSTIAFTMKTKTRKEGKAVYHFDIYTIDADGSNITQITDHEGSDYNPQWGKDSNTLYFISQRGSENGRHNIWEMKIKD